MNARYTKIAILILLSVWSKASPQAVKLNNDSGSTNQMMPRIAKHPAGPAAVVWLDFRNSGKGDIYMQFFGWRGFVLPGKSNMKVNDDSGQAERMYPDIAIDCKGHPIVVWADKRSGNWQIMGQGYKANVDTIGGNFLINDNTTASCLTPSIASGQDENFIVVWSDNRMTGYDIYAQWYKALGKPLAPNHLINIDTTGQQIMPRVAMNSKGRFVITWISLDGDSANVFAKIFDQNGILPDAEFQISQTALNGSSISFPNLTMRSDGSFMVVWTRSDESGYKSIFARGFNSDGTAVSNEFIVNQRYGLEAHEAPDIKALVNNSFLISWHCNRLGTNDIFYKTVGLDGTTYKSEQIVCGDAGDQSFAAFASDEYMNNIFVWTDTRNGDPDIYSNWMGVSWPNHAFCGSGFDSMIPISWDPPYGYTQVVKYSISRREGDSGPYSEVFTLDPSTRALPNQMLDWIDTDVEDGKTYAYKISMDVAEAEGASWILTGTPSAGGHYLFSKWASKVPVLDGSIDSEEWSDALQVDISGLNTDKSVTLYLKNSGTTLYIAVDDFNDTNLEPANMVGLLFDTDNSGNWPALQGKEGQFNFLDTGINFYSMTGTYPDALQMQNQGTPDGVSHSFGTQSGHVQAEISIDLSASPLSVSPGSAFGAAIWTTDPGNFFNNPYGYTGSWPRGFLWEAAETLGDLILASAEDTMVITGWPMAGRTPAGMSWAEDETFLQPPFDSSRTFLISGMFSSKVSCQNGKIFGIGSQNDGNPNIAFCMNVETGALLWRTEIVNTEWAEGAQPAIGDTLVYYGGQSGDGLYAFNKKTGVLEWIHNTGSLRYDNPVLDGSRIYVSRDSVFCLDSHSGQTIWTFGKKVFETPVVDQLNCYSYNHDTLYALNKYSGVLQWQMPSSFSSSIAVDEFYVYTFADGYVTALNKSNGTVQWAYSTPEIPNYYSVLNTISIDDKKLYFTTQIDSDTLSHLTVLNKMTGGFLWDHQFGSPLICEPAIANNIVYVMDCKEELQESYLWGFDISNGQTRFFDGDSVYLPKQPVISDHRLIVPIKGGIKTFFNAVNTDVSRQKIKPYLFTLSQNYPNPFNPVTRINFTLSKSTDVELSVYNLLGRKVKNLLIGKMTAGEHSIYFDGSNLSSGVYFYKLKTSEACLYKKMLLLR